MQIPSFKGNGYPIALLKYFLDKEKKQKMDRTTQGNIRVADHKRLGGVWRTMINRCELPSTRHYGRYGGRGIKVCEEWHIFSNFYKWAIENGYDEDAPRGQYTIDRINNDGDYTPDNCRWITQAEQCLNKSNNRFIEIDGEIHTVLEWCNILKLDRSFVNNRINQYHWDEKRALLEPKCAKYMPHYIEIDGVVHTLQEWCKINGIKPTTASCRIRVYGWDEIRAVTEPTHEECRTHKTTNNKR